MTRPLRSLPLLLLLAACTTNTSGDPKGSPAKEAAPKAPETPKAPASPKAPATPEAPAAPDAPTPPETPETPAMAPPAPVTPQIEAEVASGLNAFGLDLYRATASQPGDQVISPASVAIALAMTHAGARGQTAKEMETALHLARPLPEVHGALAGMLTRWNENREGLELSVANRLFGEATVSFEQPYVDLTQAVFASPLEPVDFQSAAQDARSRINGWVEEQTRDRIKELVPPDGVNAGTRLVLVNAIYFKSQWMKPFQEGQTTPAPFHAASGAHDVPTMHSTDFLNFAQSADDGVSVVELSYGAMDFSMALIIPTAKDGLAAVEASLTAEKLDGWLKAGRGERISLALPKFRIAPSESLRLGETLATLGIETAFSPRADLTGIAPAKEQLQLSECFHKGFIEVDEKGTEAAAATAIVARAGSAPPTGEPREVKADRPFLYLIRDTRSGLVLFLGRVADPKTE